MPLLEINEVMSKHFGGAPASLCVHAEGLHWHAQRAMKQRLTAGSPGRTA